MKNRYENISLDGLSGLASEIALEPGDRIWLLGDLGAGKTTLIQRLLSPYISDAIRSPTYTYYNRYTTDIGDIYHFDLYRIEETETFSLIGGEEILSLEENICLIEWPDRLPPGFHPTKKISILPGENEHLRNIEVEILVG